MLKRENNFANNKTPTQSIKTLHAGNVESETKYHAMVTVMFTM